MIDFLNISRYRAAVAVFKRWQELGYITKEDYRQMDTVTAEKYGINSTSIYRETTCYVLENE